MQEKEKLYELSMEPKWREDAKRAYSLGKKFSGFAIRADLPDLIILEEEVNEIMDGAIDMHIHFWPYPHIKSAGWDQIEIGKRACEAGMKAIVFKPHTIPTSATTFFVQRIINKYAQDIEKKPTQIFGGITLNYTVGGLNPDAVQICAKSSGKVVWLPTHDSAHHRRVIGETGGIELLTENGEVVPQLKEIFKIIAENNMILDPCHASTKERFKIIKEAKEAGVKRIIITHPNWNVTKATIKQQLEMAKMGAYIGLFVYTSVPNFNNPNCDPLEMIEIIKQVGPENIVVATDLGGGIINVPPVEGMKLLIRILLTCEIKKKDIEIMIKKNSSYLLGLES